ncbi:hypothetical protein OsI_17204 [Oryza sativa Indica Group]|uniref:Uncharacterized protein n=1 Tax=Oryza sativa subsp. indica TaxID=39946 RepID=B8ATJ6_ORYSI|nr:hypothetical protein OsI_17204 [Oryza sativa Indica Group]
MPLPQLDGHDLAPTSWSSEVSKALEDIKPTLNSNTTENAKSQAVETWRRGRVGGRRIPRRRGRRRGGRRDGGGSTRIGGQRNGQPLAAGCR